MDLLLISGVILLLSTIGALSFYYHRLRKLVEEYENARTLVSDIVISFNKQVQKQEEKLGVIAQETSLLSMKNNKVEGKLEAQENQISQLTTKVNELASFKQENSAQLASMDHKIADITKSQQDLLEKITLLEERMKRTPVPEANIEAVIPIKQEKALEPLTPTELSVLEILANEGGKTAPEIKARVNLTREHTARLMKKLYEAGYLERTTEKIPFAYRIKEEMRKILKKSETKT